MLTPPPLPSTSPPHLDIYKYTYEYILYIYYYCIYCSVILYLFMYLIVFMSIRTAVLFLFVIHRHGWFYFSYPNKYIQCCVTVFFRQGCPILYSLTSVYSFNAVSMLASPLLDSDFFVWRKNTNVQMDVFVMLFNVNMYFEFLFWRFSNPQLLLKCR